MMQFFSKRDIKQLLVVSNNMSLKRLSCHDQEEFRAAWSQFFRNTDFFVTCGFQNRTLDVDRSWCLWLIWACENCRQSTLTKMCSWEIRAFDDWPFGSETHKNCLAFTHCFWSLFVSWCVVLLSSQFWSQIVLQCTNVVKSVGRCVHLQQWCPWSFHFKIHCKQQQQQQQQQQQHCHNFCTTDLLHHQQIFLQHCTEIIRRVTSCLASVCRQGDLVVNEGVCRQATRKESVGCVPTKSLRRDRLRADWRKRERGSFR